MSRLFTEGRVASDRGDAYVLTTVFSAMVLLFGGIASRLEWQAASAVVLLAALALMLYGIGRLVAFPVAG